MDELNNQMVEILEQYDQLSHLQISDLTPEAARQLSEMKEAVLEVVNRHPTMRIWGVLEEVSVEDHFLIPGPGGDMLARIYKPDHEPDNPVVLYFHDGGFVIGNLNSCDASCRALANASRSVVISLAYRQAPEHPFPAAREDAYSAYRWLLNHAGAIGCDQKTIAVAGEGSGANLAALVCLLAKEAQIPQPIHQVLIYPILDSQMDTLSYRKHAYSKPLNKRTMKWYLRHYLKNEIEKYDPFAFPLRQKNLKGLASATIISAQFDPLCTEAELYAENLKKNNVEVNYKCFKGVTHGFFGMGIVLSEANDAVNMAAEGLLRAYYGDDDMLAPSVEHFELLSSRPFF